MRMQGNYSCLYHAHGTNRSDPAGTESALNLVSDPEKLRMGSRQRFCRLSVFLQERSGLVNAVLNFASTALWVW